MSDDTWKDAFLLRDKITLGEFNSLPLEHKEWLIAHKNVFYQLNGSDIINLLHKSNFELRKKFGKTLTNYERGGKRKI